MILSKNPVILFVRGIYWPVGILLLVASWTFPSFAEEAELEPLPNKNSPSTLSELVSNLELEQPKVIAELKSIPDKPSDGLEQKLMRLSIQSSEVKQQIANLLQDDSSKFSFEEIAEASAPLSTTIKTLANFQENLGKQISNFTEKLALLETRSIKWNKALRDQAMDSILQARVDSHLLYLKQAEDKLKPELSRLLDIRSRANWLDESLKQELLATEKLSKKARDSLFKRQKTPLLTTGFWHSLSSLTTQDLSQAMLNHNHSFLEYLGKNKDQLWIHLCLSLLILVVLMRIKDSTFVQQAFPRLYDNPFVILLSSTLLLSYLIYRGADRAFFSIVGILLIPPLTFLFSDVLDKRYRDLVYGSAFVLFIDQARNCFLELPEFNQTLLLVQLLLSAFFSHKLAKIWSEQVEITPEEGTEEDPQETNNSKPFYWSLSQTAHFASLAFLMIVLFLIGGFWHLASFLEQNLYGALYAGILLYAGYQLARGFIYAVLLAPGIRNLNFVKSYRPIIRSRTEIVIAATFLFSWLTHTLSRLGWWKVVSEKTSWFFNLGIQAGDLFITLKGLILAGLILWAGFKLSKFIRTLFSEDIYARNDFDTGLVNTVDTTVHYTVLIGSLFAAISAIGVGFQNVALIAGALSVGIGFGLQNIVNNFVSGIILLVERPVRVGDLILVGETLGNVTRIGIRSCTVKTFDDAEIIFPNATLVTERVMNWTHSSHRARISASVGVAYGTDVEGCMKILAEATQGLPFVLKHPEVAVLFEEFGDSSLNFTIRAWVLNVNKRPEYHSSLLVALNKALIENNITIPFPQRDIHLINSPAITTTPHQ